jgi:membrane fusion protein (multidrug efflux system)
MRTFGFRSSYFSISRALCTGVALLVSVAGCQKGAAPPAPPPAPPPADVQVTTAVQQDVPVYSEWIGTTDGSINAQIRARVQGYLQERHYREGTAVKSGDLLFSIDPRQYLAALDQAKGDLGRAEAALGKTKLDVSRYTPLAKEGAMSQQELDNAIQADRGNEAAVAAARAAVRQAELNLEWTQVRAPVDGIAGISVAQIGDLISANTLLTTVSRVDPLKVTFPISEREYLKFADLIGRAMQAEKRAEKHGPPLELILADGRVYPEHGSIALPDREVDLKTGTITVVSYFPNPNSTLRPGLYAKVRVVTDTRKEALLVPQRAVQELQGSYRLAIVTAENKVSMRPVKMGARIGPLWVVEEGLKSDERVIVEGLLKVRDGAQVNPKPAQTEAVAAAPAVAVTPPSAAAPAVATAPPPAAKPGEK